MVTAPRFLVRFTARALACLLALTLASQPAMAQSILRDAETEAFLDEISAPLIKAAFADFTGVVHLKLEDAKGRLLGRAFKVKQWPTLIFLQEGEEVARLVRPQSEQAVREALEKIDTKAYRDADQAGTGGSKDP